MEGKEEIQVSADKFLLEKLLFSVIENVVKYCSGNRIVFVKWSEEEDGIHFSIKNQAEIPEEESLKYFTEPYYRVDKMGKVELSCEKPFRWTLDGENGGEYTSAVIEVVPGALKIAVPEE